MSRIKKIRQFIFAFTYEAAGDGLAELPCIENHTSDITLSTWKKLSKQD